MANGDHGEPSNTAVSQCTLNELRLLSRACLMQMFHTLSSPELEELDGEYDAVLLSQGSRAAEIIVPFLFNLRGRWLGKAFAPVSESDGIGYNRFQKKRGIEKRYCMHTYVGPSKYSDGTSFFLEYRELNSGIVQTMVDEVRRVSVGLFLGIGELGPVNMRKRIFFALVGPVAPFESDGIVLYYKQSLNSQAALEDSLDDANKDPDAILDKLDDDASDLREGR